MPGIIGPVAGNECKLYYQTTLAATFTVAGSVLITEAQDVNLSMTKSTGDVMSRASRFKTVVQGLISLELTFKYQYRAAAGGDSAFTAMRQAFFADTVWHWAVMDNINATPGVKGSEGMTFPGIITEFPLDQPLEGAQTFDVKVMPVRAYASGTLIDPAWLVIAAT